MATRKTVSIAAQFPPKLAPLFEAHRYKVLYGGRGGGKSWGIARALLLLGQKNNLRILCCREIQQSIHDSVHRLLSNQIYELGLQDFYNIEKMSIKGRNGTEFRFSGLKANPQQIKSYEGVNIAWVEEAANVSNISWQTLIPTIRADNSEIWISMNPELETDSSYIRWIKNPPPNSVVIRMNYMDNPWFTPALRVEMEHLKKTNYDDFRHVFLGECRRFLEGAVYVDELRHAYDEGRITQVPYQPLSPVEAFFDLGRRDATALWLGQRVGFEVHMIAYHEARQKHWDYFLKWLSDRPFAIEKLWLPTDAKAKHLGSKMSIEEMSRSNGWKVGIVPQLSIADGINAVRTLFPVLWIDNEECRDGLDALRHYRFEVEAQEKGGFKNEPVHDQWSHGSDAFRYAAIALKSPKARKPPKYQEARFMGRADSWMAM